MSCWYSSSVASAAKRQAEEATRAAEKAAREVQGLREENKELQKMVANLVAAFEKVSVDVREIHEAFLPKNDSPEKPGFRAPGQRGAL